MTAALADTEIWKVLDWTTGLFSVSTHGRVRNNETGRILAPHICLCNGKQYLFGEIFIGGCHFKPTIHRLVAETFIKNPHNKPCIDHKDRNPLNNHVSNLRWATHAENAANRTHKPTETSPYKGVSLHKASGKWQSQIGLEHCTVPLGLYDDPLEAHWMYVAAAVFYFGEFASDGT